MQSVAFQCLKLDFIKFDNRSLSLKDIEHALCEFHKYINSTNSNKSTYNLRHYTSRNYYGSVAHHGGSGGSNNQQKKQLLSESSNCDDCNVSFQSRSTTRRYTCDTCGRSYCNKCIIKRASIRDSNCMICDECRDIAVTLCPDKKLRYSM